MIIVDETEPQGELPAPFPYRNVEVKKDSDMRDFYDLKKEIGRGRFGTVYQCFCKENGMKFAAKFVNTKRIQDRENVEREIEVMKILHAGKAHPRLIQLYDAYDMGREMCLIQEIVDGGELFERVIDDDFVLTERACAIFMRQVCEGIELIHSKNILHLDMKPENILCLSRQGNRVKICDFGLARKYDPRKKLQVLFGTPEFVAPEVVNFEPIGFGTDMWSVGVITYVLLSGLSPFMGHNYVETMTNVTHNKYDFDDESFDDISDEAKDFIERLLVIDKSERPTPAQCLRHDWLRYPPPRKFLRTRPRSASEYENESMSDGNKKRKVDDREETGEICNTDSELETSSDAKNKLALQREHLQEFVQRWNSHPNSPYLIGTPILPKDIGELAPVHRTDSLTSFASVAVAPPSAHEDLSDFEDEVDVPSAREETSYHDISAAPIHGPLPPKEVARQLEERLNQLQKETEELAQMVQSKPVENAVQSATKLLPSERPRRPEILAIQREEAGARQHQKRLPEEPQKRPSDSSSFVTSTSSKRPPGRDVPNIISIKRDVNEAIVSTPVTTSGKLVKEASLESENQTSGETSQPSTPTRKNRRNSQTNRPDIVRHRPTRDVPQQFEKENAACARRPSRDEASEDQASAGRRIRKTSREERPPSRESGRCTPVQTYRRPSRDAPLSVTQLERLTAINSTACDSSFTTDVQHVWPDIIAVPQDKEDFDEMESPITATLELPIVIKSSNRVGPATVSSNETIETSKWSKTCIQQVSTNTIPPKKTEQSTGERNNSDTSYVSENKKIMWVLDSTLPSPRNALYMTSPESSDTTAECKLSHTICRVKKAAEHDLVTTSNSKSMLESDKQSPKIKTKLSETPKSDPVPVKFSTQIIKEGAKSLESPDGSGDILVTHTFSIQSGMPAKETSVPALPNSSKSLHISRLDNRLTEANINSQKQLKTNPNDSSQLSSSSKTTTVKEADKQMGFKTNTRDGSSVLLSKAVVTVGSDKQRELKLNKDISSLCVSDETPVNWTADKQIESAKLEFTLKPKTQDTETCNVNTAEQEVVCSQVTNIHVNNKELCNNRTDNCSVSLENNVAISSSEEKFVAALDTTVKQDSIKVEKNILNHSQLNHSSTDLNPPPLRIHIENQNCLSVTNEILLHSKESLAKESSQNEVTTSRTVLSSREKDRLASVHDDSGRHHGKDLLSDSQSTMKSKEDSQEVQTSDSLSNQRISHALQAKSSSSNKMSTVPQSLVSSCQSGSQRTIKEESQEELSDSITNQRISGTLPPKSLCLNKHTEATHSLPSSSVRKYSTDGKEGSPERSEMPQKTDLTAESLREHKNNQNTSKNGSTSDNTKRKSKVGLPTGQKKQFSSLLFSAQDRISQFEKKKSGDKPEPQKSYNRSKPASVFKDSKNKFSTSERVNKSSLGDENKNPLSPAVVSTRA